jgi:hypothetical protein
MSPHREVPLAADLGGGWFARLAEFTEPRSSIVLVSVERDEERRRLRLDLGKAMFLDPAPVGLAPRAAHDLTTSIVQRMAPARTTTRT